MAPVEGIAGDKTHVYIEGEEILCHNHDSGGNRLHLTSSEHRTSYTVISWVSQEHT